MKTLRTCSIDECKHQDELIDDDTTHINFSSINIKGSSLQNNIDEWYNHKEIILKRCISSSCPTHYRNGQVIPIENDIPDVEHEEESTVIGAPPLLYIKLRDLTSQRPSIEMVNTLNLNGILYTLQSVMIYTGSGFTGHWRSVIKEPLGYVLYDDIAEPLLLQTIDLINILKDGTDFIYQQSLSSSAVLTDNIINISNRQLKKGEKMLTMDQLYEYIHECPYPIRISYVMSDVDCNTKSTTGPWIYKALKSTTVHYSYSFNGNEVQDYILLQNLFKRGFPKQINSSKTKSISSKRKSCDVPVSPFKKLNIDESAVEGESIPSVQSTPTKSPTTSTNATPLNRKLSLVIERLDSPLKKLNIEERGNKDVQFKVPQVPININSKSKGVKILTRDELDSIITKCSQSISLVKVESDIETSSIDVEGPWIYKNKSKVVILYQYEDDCNGEVRKIELNHLQARGFPTKEKDFQYIKYSWLRFKHLSPKEGTLQEVLSQKDKFLSVLMMVHRYYQINPSCAIEEGLENCKGPQSFDDRKDLDRLHYYGKGWYTWYRRTTFEKHMETMFGTDCAIRKHELFGCEPWTNRISSLQFELLIKQTHESLQHDHSRDQIEQRLIPFSGPQCNEDRGKDELLNYNVDFRQKLKTVVPSPLTPDKAPTSGPLPTPPIQLSQPLKPDDEKLATCNFRVCSRCNKTRVLDERASKCFPLGSYTYDNQCIRPVFHCDMMVDISCDTEEDITSLPLPDDLPNTLPYSWLVVEFSDKPSLPTCALFVNGHGIHSTNTSETSIIIEVIRKFCYTGHEFCTMEVPTLVEWNRSGKINIGIQGPRRFKPIYKNLKACKFTITEGREAKCCQPWFDRVLDINNPHEILGIQKITTIKDQHSILNSLKIIKCDMCKQQTPGFDIPFNEIQLLEGGKRSNLKCSDTIKSLTESKVLKATVKLSPDFECQRSSKFTSGICTDCSRYYKYDSNGTIIPRVDYSAFVERCNADSNNPECTDYEQQNFNYNMVNLYSIENLMSTDIYQDMEYKALVDTMTVAERAVLRPVQINTIILRRRCNNIPFSKNGQICYPLKKPLEAQSLPWYQFNHLPVVVMTFKDRLGRVEEAMVDMEKIRKVVHYMTRKKICPYTKKERSYYKFADEVHYTNENLARLSQALEDPSRSSYPRNLRTLDQDIIHERADKPIQLMEFHAWLSSGYEHGSGIWNGYKAKCLSLNLQPCVEDLLEDIRKHFRSFESENATNSNHQNVHLDDVVTTCNIIQYCATEKWIHVSSMPNEMPRPLSTTTKYFSGNIPENFQELLFNICEELELIARDGSNDEGQASSVAFGARLETVTENPDVIINERIQDTALSRVPLPQPNYDEPIPEHTPGYFQKAFPFIFLSGNGCPWEPKPRDIKVLYYIAGSDNII